MLLALNGMSICGRPHRHSIVVLGGDHRVLRTASLDQVSPRRRIVLARREASELLHVIFMGHLLVVEGPAFVHPVHAVDAPVDEDAQLGVLEPLHFRPRRFGPLRKRIVRNEEQEADDQQLQASFPGFWSFDHSMARCYLSKYRTRSLSAFCFAV